VERGQRPYSYIAVQLCRCNFSCFPRISVDKIYVSFYLRIMGRMELEACSMSRNDAEAT